MFITCLKLVNTTLKIKSFIKSYFGHTLRAGLFAKLLTTLRGIAAIPYAGCQRSFTICIAVVSC